MSRDVAPKDFFGFGDVYAWEPGRSSTLVEVAGEPLMLTAGRLGFCDPSWVRFTDVELVVELTPGRQPTALSGLELRAPVATDRITRGAAAVVGRPREAREWRPALGADATTPAVFDVGGGIGCAFDVDRFAALKESLSTDEAVLDLFERRGDAVIFPLLWDGEVVGIAFDCGAGDGSYPVLVGYDEDGTAVAALADLELLHHAEGRLEGG